VDLRPTLPGVVVVGIAVAVLLLGGCSASIGGTGEGRGSLQATAPQGLTDDSAEASSASDVLDQPGSASPGTAAEPVAATAQDIKTIDAELNAMQKELDSLAMPSDSDFAGAEGALY
jgi:uncharacterized protein YceK